STPGYTPFVLLNYKNKLEDIEVMMHELGHGIHYNLTDNKQSYFSFDPGTPLAETASIFNEMLLAERIVKQSKNKKEKIGLLATMLERQYATISRQAYLVIFEKYAHENISKGATKEDLDNYYYSLLKEQFGKMKIPSEYKSEWNYIPHIYLTPFYCYGYSWGGLVSISLYDMYQKEGKPFVDKYVDFLSSGGSASPYDTMNKIGANPESEEFWQGGFNIIKDQISELKKLI
ncbi:MAG TPA: M3 family metallopeptidase, partial [Alphaproteobacteria bacterium]|nr:M3 family metallopeptidase [Alphaproteobacteria bacterium]